MSNGALESTPLSRPCLKYTRRSASGRRAALSHTGALAGGDVGYGAVFRRYGMVEAVARARGIDPDSPRHLRKVTETV